MKAIVTVVEKILSEAHINQVATRKSQVASEEQNSVGLSPRFLSSRKYVRRGLNPHYKTYLRLATCHLRLVFDIPEGLAELGIRQHVVDHYNSGEMLALLNIFHVDFESISVHIGKKTKITWQPGKPWSSKRPYYFCKLGRFTLTVLTDTEQNLTRTEVYFGHHKQLIYTSEKEISKELATVELQNFLSGLAVELQTLSHIEFSEDEV